VHSELGVRNQSARLKARDSQQPAVAGAGTRTTQEFLFNRRPFLSASISGVVRVPTPANLPPRALRGPLDKLFRQCHDEDMQGRVSQTGHPPPNHNRIPIRQDWEAILMCKVKRFPQCDPNAHPKAP